MERISLEQARRFVLHHQLHRFQTETGREGVLRIIRALGYIQIDTVSVIERAHHHALWTRMPLYQKTWLDDLHARERSIFEYWGHALSYLPMEDYPYYRYNMLEFRQHSKWYKEHREKYRNEIPVVLERIRKEGPLGAKDFPDPTVRNRGWGEWKPANAVLEMLYWSGELMITSRLGFQRQYDLRERVLPLDWQDHTLTAEDVGLFFTRKALLSQGISTLADIQNHLLLSKKELLKRSLLSLRELGEVKVLQVEGITQEHYVHTSLLTELAYDLQPSSSMQFLSPFDPVTIIRPRLKRLFEFDYTLECYLPEARRKYGYWSLPILWKDRFIGTVDLKADRAKNTMIVRRLHLQPGAFQEPEALHAFAEELSRFCDFNGCHSVSWETKVDASLKKTCKETQLRNSSPK